MEKTTSEKICEEYALFGIPTERIPAYENPFQFSQNFKQCSVVEYKSISYSSNTAKTEPIGAR
jgi:hypothetical protein